jgi:hypothetical protein
MDMDEKFAGKPVVRDIEICKKCRWFKTVNDPITGRGWHWGVGVYCSNFPHKYNVTGWCVETPHAVSEEEFVRATKIYVYPEKCVQYKKS